MNQNLDLEITIKVTISDAIDKDTLDKEFNGDLTAVLNRLLETEHLFSLIDDDYQIIDAYNTDLDLQRQPPPLKPRDRNNCDPR